MTLVRFHNRPAYAQRMNPFFNSFIESMNNEQAYEPATNILKNEEYFEIQIALPGYSKEEIKIVLDDKNLRVSYEATSNETEAKEKPSKENYLRQEFGKKEFTKHFTLSKNTVWDDIQASYDQGILKLRIPYTDPEKNKVMRQISVN